MNAIARADWGASSASAGEAISSRLRMAGSYPMSTVIRDARICVAAIASSNAPMPHHWRRIGKKKTLAAAPSRENDVATPCADARRSVGKSSTPRRPLQIPPPVARSKSPT